MAARNLSGVGPKLPTALSPDSVAQVIVGASSQERPKHRRTFRMADTALPPITPGDEAAWVRRHLGHLCRDEPAPSAKFRGTQAAADTALAIFDVTGYAARRNEVFPFSRRGASGLSPWIRHGFLQLPAVWEAVAEGPLRDVDKFRDELLWQEYSRHLYARVGTRTARPLRYAPNENESRRSEPWDRSMACIDLTMTELENDGWLVNQTRMWLASQWTVRHGAHWQDGEDRFFTHLLDGSRAANRLGWQWTVGAGTGKPYGFSRWQVNKRAPGLCAQCEHHEACPIESWPAEMSLDPVPEPGGLRASPDHSSVAGPPVARSTGNPTAVWLTAESLGDSDPALNAHPDLPAVFVFDEPLLSLLQLSGKRLVFFAERLAELGRARPLQLHLGRPVSVLADWPVATTFAPVPGWQRISDRIEPVEVHPWPWLRRPRGESVASFSAWRSAVRA